jgi:hypothetical protein
VESSANAIARMAAAVGVLPQRRHVQSWARALYRKSRDNPSLETLRKVWLLAEKRVQIALLSKALPQFLVNTGERIA